MLYKLNYIIVYIRHCVLLDKTVPTNSQHEGVERLTVDAV